MSELLVHAARRKELLKHMILELHRGTAPDAVRKQLVRNLGEVPYNEVVEVEQELIAEGLPVAEILELCDIHTEALRGTITLEKSREAPPGHPIHTFKEENRALNLELQALKILFKDLERVSDSEELSLLLEQIRTRFNALSDVEKHYSRKEQLLFPFLEGHGITGPSTVMWGKHDQVRELLSASLEALRSAPELEADEVRALIPLILQPTNDAIEEMIYKEEQILFPMALDTLTEQEWFSVYHESLEIGFCLYDPTDSWGPAEAATQPASSSDRVQLPSGSFTPSELAAVLNAIPFDLTFVDKEDRVRFFTQGRERIFARSRAILGRQVQLCHPPKSVHIVEQILADFRSGREERAPFWIEFKGRFVHIEYLALRDKEGNYLGCLEVSQDLTEKRKLEGEQRLLQYEKD
jgi:uncharacterized protein